MLTVFCSEAIANIVRIAVRQPARPVARICAFTREVASQGEVSDHSALEVKTRRGMIFPLDEDVSTLTHRANSAIVTGQL